MVRLSRILLVLLLGILFAAIYLEGSGYLDLTPSGKETATGIVDLSPKGDAPDFEGITQWINSEPLTVRELRGKVVVVDFWTYSCVNCQRTLPYLRAWHEKYASRGLVIVGVHSPEFSFEKAPANVRRAVKKYGVKWPVAMDNDLATWTAYDNHYWPHKYLIDRRGVVRFDHIGEGGYRETERVIQKLLSEGGGPAVKDKLVKEGRVPIAIGQTPELYAGSERGVIGNGEGFVPVNHTYRDPGNYQRDRIYLNGRWRAQAQSLQHARSGGGGKDYLALRFRAKDVYVVTSGNGRSPHRVDVELDGKHHSSFTADLPTLYHVVSLDRVGTHTIRLSSESKDFGVYAFTFGS